MQGWLDVHTSINKIHHINRIKGKYHRVILTVTEKGCDKIQLSLHDKSPEGITNRRKIP
jgi:hypothetical protein